MLFHPTAGEQTSHIVDEAFQCHLLVKIPLVVLHTDGIEMVHGMMAIVALRLERQHGLQEVLVKDVIIVGFLT